MVPDDTEASPLAASMSIVRGTERTYDADQDAYA